MNKGYKKYILIMTVTVVFLNLIAWISRPFCDWYIRYIFQLMPEVFGRISGIFPFSVGEIMIVLGILLLFIAAVGGILLLIPRIRKIDRFTKIAKKYYRIILVIILNVCLVMTLNCSMLYHCTRINPNPAVEERDYTLDELEKLYVYIIEECNAYAKKMDRDDKGRVVYDKDMKEVAKQAMRNISKDYKRLKGYYPDVKDMAFSNLMSQAYMGGYYFPFSMEANVNAKMYIMNYPSTYCHELSHLQGYIYEDEANFLGYLACLESGDDMFIYSGYLSVLAYVSNAYYRSCNKISPYEAKAREDRIPYCLAEVVEDMVFLLPETWEEVEEKAIVDTDKMDQISTTFTETTLQMNGVTEGMAAYDGVVELLLKYYDGELY